MRKRWCLLSFIACSSKLIVTCEVNSDFLLVDVEEKSDK